MQTSFKHDPEAAQIAAASLTTSQRKALGMFAFGGIMAIFVAGFFHHDLRLALFLSAFSLACATGALYILWRSSASRISFFTLLIVLFGCVATLAAALALA